MLAIEGLEASYGVSQVLFGIDLRVEPGRLVTLLGRNGMGKTTTVRATMGLLPVRAGRVRFEGRALERLPPHRIARAGLGLVPEGRQIFPTLTVEENLIATASRRNGSAQAWTLDRVYAFLPRLAERRRHLGDRISGGEQQMLAIGRALMGNPTLLLMDEPLEGLAPIIVETLLKALKRLMSEDSLAIVLVEQHAKLALQVTRTALVMRRGKIVHQGDSDALLANPDRLADLVMAQ